MNNRTFLKENHPQYLCMLTENCVETQYDCNTDEYTSKKKKMIIHTKKKEKKKQK